MKFYKILLIIVALSIFNDLLAVGVTAIFSINRDGVIFNFLLYHADLFAKLILYVPLIVYVTRKYKLNLYRDFRFGNLKTTSLLIALAILIYLIITPFVNLATYRRLIKQAIFHILGSTYCLNPLKSWTHPDHEVNHNLPWVNLQDIPGAGRNNNRNAYFNKIRF